MVYRHPELGFEIRPEPGWRLLDEQPDRVALALPGPDLARPAILTVLAEPLVAGVDAAAFADAVLAADPELRVRDRAADELGGLPGIRVVSERSLPEGDVGVVEQWHAVQTGRGWVAAALLGIEGYAEHVPRVRAVIAGLVLPPPIIEPAAAPPPTGSPWLVVQREGAPPVPAWREGDRVRLLRPGEPPVTVAADRLPGVVAGLVGLGPRSTAPDRARLTTTVAELAKAFTGSAAAPSPAAATTVADVVVHRRAHWRVDEAGPGGHSVLEAIDAPGGWWLIRPGRDAVVLEPTDAAALWGHLAELARRPGGMGEVSSPRTPPATGS